MRSNLIPITHLNFAWQGNDMMRICASVYAIYARFIPCFLFICIINILFIEVTHHQSLAVIYNRGNDMTCVSIKSHTFSK